MAEPNRVRAADRQPVASLPRRARCGWRGALAAAFVSLAVLALPAPAARAQGAGFSVIRDAETETVLRTYASPLFRAAGLESNLVRIILVNAQGINAYVTPGNRMFIHTGLILQTQGVMELAGVLAHETGHIAGGHLARLPEEMRRAMIASIAAAIVGAAAGAAAGRAEVGAAAAIGGASMAQRSLFAFTRSQEQAADQAAIRYMERLGWSAQGLETLLGRMIDQDLLIAGRRDPYLMTHPLTRERLDFVRNHLARSRFTGAPPPPGFEASFALMRAKLRAFLEAPQRTLAAYRDEDRSEAARYARAIALFRSGRWQESVAILDGMIAERPGSPWLHELKGQVLFESGRARDSLPPHREAVRLAPREALIRLAYGRALMESNDPAMLHQAIGEFEAALRTERDSAFTWRQLGIAYGRAGNMGMSSLALAEEALLLGRPGEARMLATRATAQLPPGPTRLRAQDLAAAAAEERRQRER